MNKWISRLTCEKQPVKKPRVKHMTGIEESYQLSFSRLSRGKGQPSKDLRKSLFGKNYVLLYQVFTHTIYILITHKVQGVLFREKILKNTLEI